jgi:hypothetical protein
MERVVFLLEYSNERIGCLLNPESLEIRRVTGVSTRPSAAGRLSGNQLTDDPILYTGGGRTEMDLHLLFDVNIDGSSIISDDVRHLTAPFWKLSESAVAYDGYGRPPIARFIWGKAWNMPGVVVALAERLEMFSRVGVPSRSWLSMRFLRVASTNTDSLYLPDDTSDILQFLADRERIYGVGSEERLDELAYRYYGDPRSWRVIADANEVLDPLHLSPGLTLTIPDNQPT